MEGTLISPNFTEDMDVSRAVLAYYPLVMTNSLPWYRWPIEIDGLPNLKMVDLSMAMLNNQMVSG